MRNYGRAFPTGGAGIDVTNRASNGGVDQLLAVLGIEKDDLFSLTKGLLLSDDPKVPSTDGFPKTSMIAMLVDLTKDMTIKREASMEDLARFGRRLANRNLMRRDLRKLGCSHEDAVLLTLTTGKDFSVKDLTFDDATGLVSEVRNIVKGFGGQIEGIIDAMCT